jgi:hypothetical protein
MSEVMVTLEHWKRNLTSRKHQNSFSNVANVLLQQQLHNTPAKRRPFALLPLVVWIVHYPHF